MECLYVFVMKEFQSNAVTVEIAKRVSGGGKSQRTVQCSRNSLLLTLKFLNFLIVSHLRAVSSGYQQAVI